MTKLSTDDLERDTVRQQRRRTEVAQLVQGDPHGQLGQTHMLPEAVAEVVEVERGAGPTDEDGIALWAGHEPGHELGAQGEYPATEQDGQVIVDTDPAVFAALAVDDEGALLEV